MILSNDKPDKGLRLDEKAHVENPLLDQLEKLGWTVLRLEQKQEPQESFRQHFGQVVLLPKLEEALRKINPFLRESQVSAVARRITTFSQKNLIENNRQVLQYLLENTTVSVNHDTGEASPTVRFVDFKNRANNSFIAISQFKVKIPGTEQHDVAGRENLRGEPAARVVFREHQLHVLGVSASGRDARREWRNSEVALLKGGGEADESCTSSRAND